jgi:hypothetical protein
MRLETRAKDGQVIGFLVELDVILDTRLGLMDVLHPETAVKLISNPTYFRRKTDHFEALCGYPDKAYEEAWKTRTKEVLAHSINTPALDMLHYSVLEAEHRAATHPAFSGVRVDINIYPYDLNEEERTCMALSIAQRAGWKAPIRIVNQPPQYYDPKMVKEDYDVMMLYNVNAWLDAHKVALTGFDRIPGVTLYLPRLMPEEKVPTEIGDWRKYGAKMPVDIFEAVTYACAEFIALEWVPINHYCIAYPGVNDIPADEAALKAMFEASVPTA